MISMLVIILQLLQLSHGVPHHNVYFTQPQYNLLSDDIDLEYLKETIINVNDDLSKRNLTSIELGESSYDIGLESLELKNGTFGNFSTLLIHCEVDQYWKIINYAPDVKNIGYEITIGLEEFIIKFDWIYRFLNKLSFSGLVSIEVPTNTARLSGTISLHTSGDCKATLANANVSDLGDYRVTVVPRNILTNIVNLIMDIVEDLFGNILIVHKINEELLEVLHEEIFIENFSNIVCRSLPPLPEEHGRQKNFSAKIYSPKIAMTLTHLLRKVFT